MDLGIDDDDLIFAIAVTAGAILVLEMLRFRSAAATPTFAGTAPGNGSPLATFTSGLPMVVSPNGRAFIKAQEGLSLNAYADAGGRTIGYGHKIQAGENIPAQISISEANSLFENDVGHVEETINAAVAVPLSQSQFDALADFVFNVGSGAFQTSTLLRDLNARNYAGAAQQFSVWIFSAKKVNPTLVNRRRAEQRIFNTPGAA